MEGTMCAPLTWTHIIQHPPLILPKRKFSEVTWLPWRPCFIGVDMNPSLGLCLPISASPQSWSLRPTEKQSQKQFNDLSKNKYIHQMKWSAEKDFCVSKCQSSAFSCRVCAGPQSHWAIGQYEQDNVRLMSALSLSTLNCEKGGQGRWQCH
jgi:hypothetical protein